MSTVGAPQPVNSRPRRPCDACRKRKSRCEINEGDSTCILCRFHHQECTFNEKPAPRKKRRHSLSPEGSENGPGLTVDDTRTPRNVQWDRGSSSSGARLPSHYNIRQALPVDDYAKLKGPTLLRKTLGLQTHRHSRLLGSSSVIERDLLQLQSNEREDLLAAQASIRRVCQSEAFLLVSDTGTKNHEDEISDLDEIESIVAPHGEALIHLYFRIVHPSFPILHKKVFLEKYQRTHREFSPPLLAAVYIIALNWWSYSAELATFPKPDVPRLEKLALKTMNDVIYRPKLSTIQAGLLLLQRPGGDSWALISQLVSLGQDLGLHLDCSTWKIPSWERGVRKRLAWALYMQDKWGALVHGRPSHITTADWRVRPVLEDDFPESAADEDNEEGSTEVEKGRVLFCEMIRLTEILSLILSEFYSLQAEEEAQQQSHAGVRWLLDRAKPIQLKLKEWYSSLPEMLKMESLKLKKLSSTGYMHLAYYAAEMTLHRVIVRFLPNEKSEALLKICRTAAQARLVSSMEFVKSLRPEHLQSFWCSASTYNFALAGSFVCLLWLTAPTMDEKNWCMEKLEEYKWTLRLSSRSAEFLEGAIGMLTMSTAALVKNMSQEPVARGANRDFQVEDAAGMEGFAQELDTEGYQEELTPSDTGYSQLSPDVGTNEQLDQSWFEFDSRLGNFNFHDVEPAGFDSRFLQTGTIVEVSRPFVSEGGNFGKR